MPGRETILRIKRIQKHLNVTVDGIVGPGTLTALENALFTRRQAETLPNYTLTISKKGFRALVRHEISSPEYYRLKLQRPYWPGGSSGITIGIGYDLGYNSKAQIRKDWKQFLSDDDLNRLLSVAGKKATTAKQSLTPDIRKARIPFDAASDVFSTAVLPRYAKLTVKAYPGVEKLFPDAQAVLLSLLYNRGTAMSGSRRREMKAIQPLVKNADYDGIAQQIRAMKRLWVGMGLDGLLKRRDDEANLVKNASANYSWKDLIRL
jgi:hypothetical protein